MPLAKFDPPGFLKDFNAAQEIQWSQFMSDQFDNAVKGNPDDLDFDGPREQFFNPLKVDIDQDKKVVDITWTGFPRNVTLSSVSDVQRWRRADSSRDLQDEYCEWSVDRDPVTDKITRVTFTCEGPEYWGYLAKTTPKVALSLYQKFVSPDVKRKDLFPNGTYDARNKWNGTTTGGAMHLIQVNNSLAAEIELAGGSSVVRVIDGQMLTGEQELIACGRYGGASRHSDPHIGALVNSLTRLKADVTLDNPVGLYFADLNPAGWETPDGSDPKTFWKYVRGTPEKPVRAIFEVPKTGHDFVVGDITIQGRTIDFGAQIADFINMKLTGVGTRFGKSSVQPMTGCRKSKAPEGDVLAEPTEMLSVAEALGRDFLVTR